MSEAEQSPVHQEQAGDGEDTSVASAGDDTSATASPVASAKDKKIEILLKATGDAPIMKKKKWTVDPTKRMGWIASFIKKYLKYEPSDSIFLYINQSFSPAPDIEVGTLYDCFGTDGQLVIHYCKTQAWG